MRTMTVLPTHLYKKLIKQSPDFDEHLRDQKDEILSTDLPPEIKARLYQDIVRTIAKRKLEDENKPLLVKSGAAIPSKGGLQSRKKLKVKKRKHDEVEETKK